MAPHVSASKLDVHYLFIGFCCGEAKQWPSSARHGPTSARTSGLALASGDRGRDRKTGDININGSTLINCLEIELLHYCFKVLLCRTQFVTVRSDSRLQ